MLHIHLRPDATTQTFSDKTVSLSSSHTTVKWKRPHPLLQQRLCRLTGEGSPETSLCDEEEGELAELFYLLETLKQQDLLAYTIIDKKEGPLITLVPHVNTHFQLKEKTLDPKATFWLSRFAFLHTTRDACGFVCESPLVGASLFLKHPMSLQIFHALASPKSLEELLQEFPQFSEETLQTFLTLLYQASFLNDTEQDPSLITWEFHDLLFHTRSRQGRHSQRSGATFRFLNQIPPVPALRPKPQDLIPLFQPDMAALKQTDPSFTKVMEARKSVRDHGKTLISKEQLGEFFYRVARVKDEFQSEHYGATHRPYPGGGACYELELYPVIDRCNGFERGLYRYHPDAHALHLCTTNRDHIDKLLESAAQATSRKEFPQILILIAARFQRISWKYESMAYAVILKNTGILIQTLYLTATAMNLAPCGIGCGNADLFAQTAGTNYYEETTVGEFILGCPPQTA